MSRCFVFRRSSFLRHQTNDFLVTSKLTRLSNTTRLTDFVNGTFLAQDELKLTNFNSN